MNDNSRRNDCDNYLSFVTDMAFWFSRHDSTRQSLDLLMLGHEVRYQKNTMFGLY